MCDHGDYVDCQLTVLGSLAHEGEDTVKTKPVDQCIADIVRALEAAGIRMYGSCCGHGQRPGEIPLADGRVVMIVQPQDFQELGEPWRQKLGIDGTAGDAQDVDHPFIPTNPGGPCVVCGLAKSYRRHRALAPVADPDPHTTSDEETT
jgi:hypothetical protein